VTKLTKEEQKLKNAGMVIVGAVSSEFSVYGEEPQMVNATNVPDDTEPAIYEHLRSLSAHEVYGSVPAKSQSPVARAPADIDMVVPEPKVTAQAIKAQLEARGHKTNVTSNPQFGSYVVQVENEKGEFVDAADIHPLEGHYTKYEVHGESLPPYKMNGVFVQRLSDQLMRKANSVLGNNNNGKFGAAPHRQLKDEADFVTTARTLIDSKKLQAEADIKKAAEAEKALKLWEKRVKKHPDYSPKMYAVGRDPIPEKQEQKFIKFAEQHPEADVDNIVLGTDGHLRIVNRDKGPIRNTGELANPALTGGKMMCSRGRPGKPEKMNMQMKQERYPSISTGIIGNEFANVTAPAQSAMEFGNIGRIMKEEHRNDFGGLGQSNPFGNTGMGMSKNPEPAFKGDLSGFGSSMPMLNTGFEGAGSMIMKEKVQSKGSEIASFGKHLGDNFSNSFKRNDKLF
jgi:hypothetical protein